MAKPFLIANWTTIRCSGPNVVTFTQDEEEWPDVKGYQDLGLQLDVSEVTAPTGTTVSLTLQSSPTVDEALFQPVCPPIALAASSTTVPFKTIRIPSTQPVARFVRWQISVQGGTSGSWGATFRIRGIPVKSRFFVPPDVPGCLLWVRADLGITIDATGGGVSVWADQSGNGNNLSTGPTQEPSFNAIDSAYNNMATLSFGSGKGMTSPIGFVPPDTGEVFIVGNSDGGTGARTFLDGDAVQLYRFRSVTSTVIDFTRAVGLTASINATGSPHVYDIEPNAANTKIFVDSPTAITTGDPGGSGPTQLSVGFDGGGANSLLGKIAELVVFNQILSQDDRTRIMRYLGSRYGIRITP